MNNKKLIAIIAIVTFVVLDLFYVGFWVFKAQQYKKQVNNFVESANQGSKKDYNISVGSVEVKGFPFSHKIVIKDAKFFAHQGKDFPAADLIINTITLESAIISHNNFAISLSPVRLEDANNNLLATLEYNSDAKFDMTVNDNQEVQFKYSGSGYKTLDAKNNVYSIVESKNAQMLFLYSQVLKQFKYSNAGYKILDAKNNVLFSSAPSSIDIKISSVNKKYTGQFDIKIKDCEFPMLKKIQNQDRSVKDNNKDATVVNNAKSNLLISAIVNVAPNEGGKVTNSLPDDQMAALPPQYRAQFQNQPAPYIWDIDLKNWESSNSEYKILINGKLATFPDEEIPSGLLNVKIENIDNFIKAIVDNITKASEVMEKSNNAKLKKHQGLAAANAASQIALQMADRTAIVLKDLATKNPLSSGSSSVFEIKRDKKSDVIINKTSPDEILAKLLAKDQENNAVTNPVQQPVNSVLSQPVLPNNVGVKNDAIANPPVTNSTK